MLRMGSWRGRAWCGAAVLAAAVAATPAGAAAQMTGDPVGDFLASYTGPRNADLDVTSVGAFFDGSNFLFASQSAGPIGLTPGGLHVWGVNRGLGTAGFAGIGITNVLFDAVIIVDPAAGITVRDIPTNTVIGTLGASNVFVDGNQLRALVPLALLPQNGALAPLQYTANLWPRSGAAGGAAAISDFAPDNSNIAITATPEPATLLLVAPALVGLGVVARRRRNLA